MGHVLEFYRQFIGSDDLVFDIGASCGSRTELFSRLAQKVVSVEPTDDSFSCLATVFQFNENVVAIQKACGSGFEPGKAQIMLYDPTIPTSGASSMSKEWVEAVRKSKRFGDHGEVCWVSKREVAVTTLDQLIADHGLPSFIKIDVEGYEPQVLCGLSTAVKAMSFEFTPERLVDAFACIDHCVALGMKEFAISLKESFELTAWDTASVVKAQLKETLGDNTIYGDLYARIA